MDLLERFWRRAISVQPHTQLGEIPLDIPPTELDHPRCPISTPIDLSRRGETRLTRSTRGGFADVCDLTLDRLRNLSHEAHIKEFTHFDVLTGVRRLVDPL